MRGTSLKKWKREEVEANQRRLLQMGPTHEQRTAVIDSIFEQQSATMAAVICIDWDRIQDQDEAESTLNNQVRTNRGMKPIKKRVTVQVLCAITRNLAGMDNRELTYLRVAQLLDSTANGENPLFRKWRAALIWGDGKAVVGTEYHFNLPPADEASPVAAAMDRWNMSVEQTLNAMQQFIAAAGTDPNSSPAVRQIALEIKDQIAPTGSSGWLKPSDVQGTVFAQQSPHPLYIGAFADGTWLSYSGDGSIVTIAPPGSGKTQCNVFPNLLMWNGPAIVLDVSGDIYENTAAWRSSNVGPVFKFSPLDPEDSHKYNPLTFVRQEPDFIWEDSRLLAEMMIVPSGAADPFWENEARTVLTSAIAYVCYSNGPTDRPMYAVLDVLFGGQAWKDMILGLKMAIDVRVMTQHATSLESMNEKTLSSVLQTARSSLGAWTGERVARVTARSDWNPLDLRNGTNPTIYISVRPNEVEAYLSLLRVFIGQHIRVLTGGPVPPRDAAPILVMLDELPRLRYMAPVDEALNIGRKYGLRLWMFAQSVGQLQTSYENANGMLGSCAVRIYMNPSGADGLAERLSEELGYVDSLNDNSRRRLVEAAELAGPAYNNQQLVLSMGTRPAAVQKSFAYSIPQFAERMSLDPQTIALI